MQPHVDYYFSLTSPWSYLGHEPLLEIVAQTTSTITPFEVSFRKTIFSQTGGLPVHKRAPQRQAYRLQELARWRDYLGVELNVHPKHWPNDETVAANMLIVLRETHSIDTALRFTGPIMRGVWAEDRDIADKETLIEIANEAAIDGAAVIVKLQIQNGPKYELRKPRRLSNVVCSVRHRIVLKSKSTGVRIGLSSLAGI